MLVFKVESRQKKILLILVVLISLFILIVLSYLALNKYKSYSQFKKNTDFAKLVKNDISTRIKDERTIEFIDKQLGLIINASTSKPEKYEALVSIASVYANEYSTTNDPTVRDFSKDTVAPFAKQNFPDLYNEMFFVFFCADPVCGQSLSPEIKEALDVIDKSEELSEIAKITISENITNAGYMTDRKEKVFGITFATGQLRYEGIAEASRAAEILINYLINNYQVPKEDLFSNTENFPNE